MVFGKRILLIIGGGIAAYKSLELIRRLKERGASVRVALTGAAEEFVTPLTAGALSGDRVYKDLFDLTAEAEMGHIQLSRDADLLIVAPATADLMAKMAHGMANDLASTLLLATDKPVMIAPAMNVRMWLHPATQRNLATLRADGVHVIGPNQGDMACGEFGPGRMAEPDEIVKAVVSMFVRNAKGARLRGARIVVTSGPTHEPIDPVRYIANRSSGKQGAAIADALARRGAEVIFVTGPASAPPPEGCTVVRVETAEQMLEAVMRAMPADAAVCAAAVADWRVASAADQKMKKTEGENAATLSLVQNPDILATISALEPGMRPGLVVGFAAETNDVENYARAKLRRKGCDWIVANDVSAETGIMGGDENAVLIVTPRDVERWPRMPKREVAERLADRIAATLRRTAPELGERRHG